ncbi:MAG TPA: AcvB/VirJ family lysyl-phosphatidylglycerol hydrolase [Nitrospirota bacterium]|nr:AcvB/VirJ family lysyl-phosphatidylglycerol hydrolase [Nitrospirota bacterium]
MKLTFCILAVLVTVLLSSTTMQAGEESFSFGPFGRLFLYQKEPSTGVVLFVSGDGGWNRGVVDMARALSGLGPAVVGMDITHYLKTLASSDGACSYPAADFEALSKYVQKKLNYRQYTLPVLVGYSSGATLVYAVLAQAPPNTFRGGISLGFCPDLAVRKSLCRGQGLDAKSGFAGKGEVFLPDGKLKTPWIVLQGAIDEVCSADEAQSFVRRVSKSDIVVLPKVGHGFSVERNWMPELRKAFQRLTGGQEAAVAAKTSLGDLPLVEVPSQGNNGSDFFAVIISGDGGWAGLDREVGGALAQRGIPVVGLNALQYFWTKRTPDGASEDLVRILRHYQRAWNKDGAVLIGYSLGADVLPFMANRLPRDVLERVQAIVLLGPGRAAEFEFHFTEWLEKSSKAALPVLPEVERLRGKRVLCVYSAGEQDSLCPELEHEHAELVRMPGGHHFGGEYESIAETILRRIPGE